MARTDVCALDDLPPGSITVAELNGRRVCVANVHGELFAVQDRCPHLGAPLSVGDLNGANIVCPWHQSEFDMRTGRTKKWLPTGLWHRLDRLLPPPPPFIEKYVKPKQIRTFPVTIENGRILLSDE